MSHPWGATPDAWAHFDLMLGLTADLLPVVSNPNAKISAASKMKGLGKTPSAYNKAGEVSGIKDWTDRRTTAAQVEKWSQQSDYGICLQTREVRALDIDIPDQQLAARIARRFLDLLGRSALPTRGRADSGKRLLGFRLPGDFRKRSFKVEGGLVEFLATGQQFIAVGTHPSGTRYAWAGGLPRDFPEIAAEDFERAWAAIVAEFAIEPERRARERSGSGEAGQELGADPVAAWLAANWETYGDDGEKLFLLCPFKDGHSGDSGETEAAWLLAGTAGYERGHFACLHASCSGRTDGEFLKAVGMPAADKADFKAVAPQKPQELRADDPAALYLAAARGLADPPVRVSTGLKKTAPHPDGVASLPLPGFERDKQGNIEPGLENVVKAISVPHACGSRIRHDDFRDELMVAAPGTEEWRAFTDADAVELRMALERIRFKPVGKELMRDALVALARRERFDSAIYWLTEVVPAWDGVERIARFYPDYFATEDTPYTHACGEYVWTAHAGRVLEPGVKADMAPVLVGEQGLRKSSGVAAISPAEDFFAELDLEVKDNDLGRKMRGVLVGELGELRGLSTRDGEAIRAWVVRRFEEWTPKFMERKARFPRRLILHGTTNDEDFLSDPTGERRWLPMRVERLVDVDRIVADRMQLWAEGRERFKAEGVLWQRAEELARGEHQNFKIIDPWVRRVSQWLDEGDIGGRTPRGGRAVRAEDVLAECLGLDLARIKKVDQQRVAGVLKACGMRRVQIRVDGRPQRVWEDENADLG